MKPDFERLAAKEARKAWKRKNQYRLGKGRTPAGHRIGKKGGKKSQARRAERRAKIRDYYGNVEITRERLAGAIQVGNEEDVQKAQSAHTRSVNGLEEARREFSQGREARLALAQQGLRAEVA